MYEENRGLRIECTNLSAALEAANARIGEHDKIVANFRERAEAREKVLREALMPFAEAASEISPNMRDDLRVPYWARPIAGDLRKARSAALAPSPAGREG
jgi:hypothetical protein